MLPNGSNKKIETRVGLIYIYIYIYMYGVEFSGEEVIVLPLATIASLFV